MLYIFFTGWCKRNSLRVLSTNQNKPSTRQKLTDELYANQKETPSQRSILFEALKKYGPKFNKHVSELTRQTNLKKIAIHEWAK